MRVEEEGSGGSMYESGGGGKWRQSVLRVKEEGSGGGTATKRSITQRLCHKT